MHMQELSQWVGRIDSRDDVVTAGPLNMMAATLDFPSDVPVTEVRPLWHWFYFLPLSRRSEAGPDGHPKRGGFLPPVPLPRRMWAGSRLMFRKPLLLGEKIHRESVISRVEHKSGRSGELVFVTVKHAISNAYGLAIEEEHDIVYREVPHADAPSAPGKPVPYEAQFSCRIVPDAVLLFRYSALTFNSHRIHYDFPYVTREEGYPDLIVHGPLVATLLAEEVQKQFPRNRIVAFEFKAMSPLFANSEFGIAGRRDGNVVHIWSETPTGHLGMLAEVELA